MEKSFLFIIGLVLGVLVFGFLIYELVKFCKKHNLGNEKPKLAGNERLTILGLVLGQGLTTILSSVGMIYWWNWQMNGADVFMLIFGSYLFGTCFACLVSSFALYYYRKDLDEKQRKISRILTFVMAGLTLLGLYLMTQGFADYIRYPLPNSFSFKTLFGYPDGRDYGFTIAFYGIIIVSGALVSYFISDHYIYKKFGKHGLIDTLLLVAFPMGLIGARLWFCLVLEPKTYIETPAAIFNIRDGGMAIMGGAILGIISGVLFILRFRKYMDIRYAIDVIVPTILIAQAIGRFGNFFNQEVYGGIVSYESISWLPRLIVNNMYIYNDGVWAYRLPLCIIEACSNLAGYFIIRYAIAKPLKNYLAIGSQAGLYITWYGLTRVILEPMRNGEFEYNQSLITAYVMVGVGILIVGAMFLWDYLAYKKTGKWTTFENV